MTFKKFNRTLRNFGWSCYFDSDGDALISRGRGQLVVQFDDDSCPEGYFWSNGDWISVWDIYSISAFPGGVVVWLYNGDGYRIHY